MPLARRQMPPPLSRCRSERQRRLLAPFLSFATPLLDIDISYFHYFISLFAIATFSRYFIFIFDFAIFGFIDCRQLSFGYFRYFHCWFIFSSIFFIFISMPLLMNISFRSAADTAASFRCYADYFHADFRFSAAIIAFHY
jgi:hypothetical protein